MRQFRPNEPSFATQLQHRIGDFFPESFGDVDADGVLRVTHNAGFFSTCSVTLLEIARSRRPVTRISAAQTFLPYKESIDEDIWLKLFSKAPIHLPQFYGKWSRRLLHHSRYCSLPVNTISSLIESHFAPSERVQERMHNFENQYKIDYETTLAVNYRGTDKSREVRPTAIKVWVKEVDKALRRMPPQSRILMQSDDENAFQELMKVFGDRSIVLEELPRSSSGLPVHEILKPGYRLDFAQNLLAMTQIISRCHTVVTHTGNVALWTYLFRGNCKRFVQL